MKKIKKFGKSLLDKVGESTEIFGGACDVIVVKQKDGSLKCSPFFVKFGRKETSFKGYRNKLIRIFVNDKLIKHVCLSIGNNGIGNLHDFDESSIKDEKQKKENGESGEEGEEVDQSKKEKKKKKLGWLKDKFDENETNFKIENNLTEEIINEMLENDYYLNEKENEKETKPVLEKKDKDKEEVLKQEKMFMSSEELTKLNLKTGRNKLTYSINVRTRGNIKLSASIFFWDHSEKIVICDIDGTVTKSDVLGHVFFAFGVDWHVSKAMKSIILKLVEKKYKIVYLTARALAQVKATKKQIEKICKLPPAPVLLSEVRGSVALYREVIKRNPEIFKKQKMDIVAKVLNINIVGGFGNRKSDYVSYKHVGLSDEKIFIVNDKGKFYMGNSKTLNKPMKFLVDNLDVFF